MIKPDPLGMPLAPMNNQAAFFGLSNPDSPAYPVTGNRLKSSLEAADIFCSKLVYRRIDPHLVGDKGVGSEKFENFPQDFPFEREHAPGLCAGGFLDVRHRQTKCRRRKAR
jgi:hypothetical protein